MRATTQGNAKAKNRRGSTGSRSRVGERVKRVGEQRRNVSACERIDLRVPIDEIPMAIRSSLVRLINTAPSMSFSAIRHATCHSHAATEYYDLKGTALMSAPVYICISTFATAPPNPLLPDHRCYIIATINHTQGSPPIHTHSDQVG